MEKQAAQLKRLAQQVHQQQVLDELSQGYRKARMRTSYCSARVC